MLPPVDLEKISIHGHYTGTSPSMLDKIAVQRIEEEVLNISGISEVTSYIGSGGFEIQLKFSNQDEQTMLENVKDAIALISSDLPPNTDDPIATRTKVSIPLLFINVAYKDKNQKPLAANVAQELKTRLLFLANISRVEVNAQTKKDIFFTLDLQKIQALRLDPKKIVSALAGLSNIFPMGEIEEGRRNLFVSTYNGEKDVNILNNVVLHVGSKVVRLKDIAKIEKRYKKQSIISSYNAKPNISIQILKSQKGNAIEISKKIKDILKEFKNKYPSLRFDTFFDTSSYIKKRLNTVLANIFLGLILVGLSMHILINKRISFVVLVGIGTSFLIGVWVLDLLDQSINVISLIGALIAIGIIVDDAIIVTENIQRHIEDGMPISKAAQIGTKEVLSPVLTSSLTTIFAFIPMLLVSGEMGAMIRQIPIAISVLILASLLESFVFLPLHSKHLLKPKTKEISWNWLLELYEKAIRFIIKYKKISVVCFWLGVPILTAFGFSLLKSEFFPKFDADNIQLSTELPVGVSLDHTLKVSYELQKAILALKDKYSIKATTGMAGYRLNNQARGQMGKNLIHVFIELKPAKADNLLNEYITPLLLLDFSGGGKREIKSFVIAEQLYADLQDTVKKLELKDLKIESQGTGVVKNPIEILIFGTNAKKTSSVAKNVQDLLKADDKTINILSDYKIGDGEVKLRPNAYAQSLGLDEQTIFNALSSFFDDASIAKGFDESGLIDFRLSKLSINNIQDLKNFYISLPDNKNIALRDMVDFVFEENPSIITKKNTKQRILVSSSVKAGFTAGEIIEKIRPKLKKLAQDPDISISFGGEKAAGDDFKKDLLEAGFFALFLISLTLLISFNSFKASFIVLSVVPLSFLGAVFGHIFMGLNTSMPSFIGMLGLAGVVINDGIVMMDFIRKTQSIDELIYRAKLRVRPILLTSITTLIGLCTLIFFPSGQAVIMQPLAVSLGFGLFWGTILNLFYVPAFFASWHKLRIKQ